MIEAQNLTRRYGEFTAVDQISFTVGDGQIVGILGPNGAGKTSTIRMVTGFIPPTSGQITVAGENLLAAPTSARRNIGYLPESVALYEEMRVSEYLANRAQLEGLGRSEARRAIAETLSDCLLEAVQRQIIGTLSRGFRQRVGLAAAILHRPGVLVLDEPTVGLDPKQIVAIRELIKNLGKERTLLLSTHILPEVELLCDRVIIIDRGRIVAEGTPESLRESWVGNTVLRVDLKGDPTGAAEVFEALEGVISVTSDNLEDGQKTYHLECDQAADPREAVFRAAVSSAWVILNLTTKTASLEDVFVRLTTREEEAGGVAETKDESEQEVES
jgi:ABC-2 type transport system ATP-binding protein